MSKGGKIERHVVEDSRSPFVSRLDRLPPFANLVGRLESRIAEDVRMAANKLAVDVLSDIGKVSGPTLIEEQCQEEALKQEVAQLVSQLDIVLVHRCVRHFVCLFDRVRHDGLNRLLAIPRTVGAEPLGERLQLED